VNKQAFLVLIGAPSPLVILMFMSRSAALLVGVVCFVVFVALYALSWIAAFGFLALWLAATVLYRRNQRR
jgi:type IV secretory pathway TrbD component